MQDKKLRSKQYKDKLLGADNPPIPEGNTTAGERDFLKSWPITRTQSQILMIEVFQ